MNKKYITLLALPLLTLGTNLLGMRDEEYDYPFFEMAFIQQEINEYKIAKSKQKDQDNMAYLLHKKKKSLKDCQLVFKTNTLIEPQ